MLVGREAELARVCELLVRHAPFAVVGEAGVGKTALLRAAAERGGGRLLEGGGLATLSWLPYLPLRRALALKHEIVDGDAHYVAEVVEREAGGAILLLDDFHWADRQTRALLPLLVGRVTIAAALRRGDPETPPLVADLQGLGFDLIELEPLDDADAAALARRANADLSETALRSVVRRSGGNPFLIEELASSGEPTESLQLMLAARLRLLSAAGREAMGLLSLAGRPLEPALLGDGAGELVEMGLARSTDVVSIRHALLAETMAANLSEAHRRALHSRLARALADPGEAARHHAAAGEREQAFARALEAVELATLAGERASHLALAAACAAGPAADELRVRAATALVEERDMRSVEDLLAQVKTRDRVLQARKCLARYRLCRAQSDDNGARRAWSEGNRLAAGTGTDIEVHFAAEEARLVLRVDRDPARAVAKAEASLELARAVGSGEATGLALLGTARVLAGMLGWEPALRGAIARARRDGDVATERRAANMLVFGLIIRARGMQARRLADEMARRCRDQHATGWETVFRTWAVDVELRTGNLRQAAADAEELLDRRPPPTDRRLLVQTLAQALTDLGRHEAARRHVDELLAAVEVAGTTEAQAIEAYWALADAEYWAGRPREALRAVETCFSRFGRAGTYDGSTASLEVVRAWALLELGEAVDPPRVEPSPPLVAAVPVELDGIGFLAAGRPLEASDRFARAADLWRDREFRGELRCLWACGEALRRGGDHVQARRRLKAAEGMAGSGDT